MLAVVKHISKVYNTAAVHNSTDYKQREAGEIPTEKYPNFPILREKAIYERDCKIEDRQHRKQSCEKEFPSHANLTPGLYLLTCGCKFKCVYGFSMMTTGESPSMLFNLVMTRFEDDYNPHIIYDASCLAKEYGYNRELKRFMSISITTDCFHEANHKTCSTSFRTSEYVKLMNVNSEACEQTNSALRKITSSTTFMSPSMYLRSLTLFLADMNICNHKKK